MSQLILTAASIGPSLAKSVAGAAGAYAAGIANRLIAGPRKRKYEGPRLDALPLQGGAEGAPVLRVFGRARVTGQLIWAARFRETVSETTERSGKGGRLSATKTTVTEYLYSLSFAVGLCEGAIDRVARVWADGKPFDLAAHNARVHRGGEDQLPDALIEAVEGAAPAFRGLAYVVFEDLPLKDFGNRVPQFSFEVEKSLRAEDPLALENALTAVTMIPGSGEFVYGTTKVTRAEREGATRAENRHASAAETDFSVSLDALLAAAPNLRSVSLVVSWFGTDLDAATCAIRPGVEHAEKATAPYDWSVNGVARGAAHLVSRIEGAPAYGGSPADACVLEAIAALKARGLEVMLHPFILMDAPGYPWRGRIGAGAADGTAAAEAAIASFFGAAQGADFASVDGAIVYQGPEEWSLRRMILHYAHLAAQAGGVERFLIGSELVGITTARSGARAYPAVAALRALAAEVRAILPGAKISYGADWTEWRGHQPADGSGDVCFHLDPLWADANIDFIGVDMYAPRADWRAGPAHLDALAGAKGPYDRAYLQANIEGGEYYDWHYPGPEDRAAQARAPIADGAYGEPWVFRAKDIRNWWANAHFDRPGGVRAATPTAWIPESKPLLFTEFGCPAVDRGANQPNVFVDPKSVESALPHFSTGARDDLAQRRMIEAEAAYWRDAAHNPVSSVYEAPMLDADRIHVYAFDARPYPFFPARADVWGDAGNWRLGHWLNGRLARAPLDLLVAALAEGAPVDTSRLEGEVAGYLLDRSMSARAAIEPLAEMFGFDMVETEETLRFQQPWTAQLFAIPAASLVARAGGDFSSALGEADALPSALRLGYFDEGAEYRPGLAEAREPSGEGAGEAHVEAPAVMEAGAAAARAGALLALARAARETARFALPPSLLAVEPGDLIRLDTEEKLWRVAAIEEAGERRIEAERFVASAAAAPSFAGSFALAPAPAMHGAPSFAVMDLPLLAGAGAEAGAGAHFAAFADPWPGAVALWRETGAGPALAALARAPSTMGRLAAPLGAGGAGRRSFARLRLLLSHGALESVAPGALFEGANALAVETEAGWEVLQFETAVLGEDGAWTLAGLLRGQAGTENAAAAGAPAGARCALLGAHLAHAPLGPDLIGRTLSWRAGPERALPHEDVFASAETIYTGRALRPPAPVHLRARRDGAGALRLSWLRRTRIGGDSWESEAPVGEAFERYRLRIFDGAALKREIEIAPPFAALAHGAPCFGAAVPNFLYTEEMILADFGEAGLAGAADPAFAVAQASDLVGWGEEGRAGIGIRD